MHISGVSRRGNAKLCLNVIASELHTQSSSSAKADDPVLRDVSDGIEGTRRTGYPAFAGYDGGGMVGAKPATTAGDYESRLKAGTTREWLFEM